MVLSGIFKRSAPRRWRAKLTWLLLSTSLLVVCVIQPTAAAAAVPQSARIKGKVVGVTADKREPLSGVVISLSSSLLQGGPLQTTSDEEGNYVFNGLVAGDYTITVELQGFQKY